jgi:formate dehydrogenase subunit gamma
MAATTRRSPSKARSSRELLRFDWVERVAHWLTAIAFLILIFTGAALYIPALVGFVGRRVLVVRIHVDAGLALPLPLIISLAGSWGNGLRADLKRLNRWSSDDKEWMRRSVHWEPTDKLATGKFNAGQKLNAAIVGGTMIVMLMTGSVMHWPYYFALSWRTGATFIHDIVALGFFVVVVGHIGMALTHPPALRSIFTGRISRAWAKRHAPVWLEEIDKPAAKVSK